MVDKRSLGLGFDGGCGCGWRDILGLTWHDFSLVRVRVLLVFFLVGKWGVELRVRGEEVQNTIFGWVSIFGG